jgi:hypothetical protein
MLSLLLESLAVRCTGVGTFRTLATTSLSCAHTRASMRSVLAYLCCNRRWPGFHLRSWAASILELGLLPVRVGRFRVCPAARPQPRLALILLLSGLPAPWSNQRDSNCATSEPGGFGTSSRQITKRLRPSHQAKGKFDESRKRGKYPHFARSRRTGGLRCDQAGK